MSDIAVQLKRAIEETLRKALAAQKENHPARAADLYDHAAKLAMRWAEKADTRRAELARKNDALRYRKIAQALRGDEGDTVRIGLGGDDGAKAAGGVAQEPAIGGAGDDASEISKAVANLVHTSSLTWDDIGGLDETKASIKFTLGVSLAKPPEGVSVALWKNILFYGPPGTGKTLLAAATSNALRTKDARTALFFNVKVSSVMSKYFGESTKIISELYGTARDHSPAVVFLDEFESLSPKRSDENSGPERRILSTILAELDGLAEKGRTDMFVLTIAATNRPWDIDPAVLSRFEKKILIPLPDVVTRRRIFDILLARKGFVVEASIDDLVARTENYAGRELERLCKEATGRMVAEMNAGLPALIDRGLDDVRTYQLKVRPLTIADFDDALALIKPAATEQDMARYRDWAEALDAD